MGGEFLVVGGDLKGNGGTSLIGSAAGCGSFDVPMKYCSALLPSGFGSSGGFPPVFTRCLCSCPCVFAFVVGHGICSRFTPATFDAMLFVEGIGVRIC